MSVNHVVVIPDNYTEGKLYLTGGRLSVNTIFETLVIVGIACGLEMLLLPSFFGVFKIGLIVITAITLGYFTIAGVDGLTMSEFLLWFISYLNNRETLSFRAIKKRVRPEKKAQKKDRPKPVSLKLILLFQKCCHTAESSSAALPEDATFSVPRYP